MLALYDPILQDLRSGDVLADSEIEIVAPGNTGKDQNGNWKWKILPTTFKLVLQKYKSGAWVTVTDDRF
jgi:hypothetical protein